MIVAEEAHVSRELAIQLVKLAHHTRALKNRGLDEGVSTRMLIYAATLIRAGVTPRASCEATMTQALTDDPDVTIALRSLVEAQFA